MQAVLTDIAQGEIFLFLLGKAIRTILWSVPHGFIAHPIPHVIAVNGDRRYHDDTRVDPQCCLQDVLGAAHGNPQVLVVVSGAQQCRDHQHERKAGRRQREGCDVEIADHGFARGEHDPAPDPGDDRREDRRTQQLHQQMKGERRAPMQAEIRPRARSEPGVHSGCGYGSAALVPDRPELAAFAPVRPAALVGDCEPHFVIQL